VDAAEELDDRRAGSGGLRRADAEEGEGEEEAETRTGVGLDEEQDRLARLGRLLDAEGREHTVVDGVVEASSSAASTRSTSRTRSASR
jgi:hypothetical protein